MSEHRGYEGNSLKFLKANQISVGDSVKILSDITYSGIIMPRYEHSDDKHIVLKLKNGYNIGLEIAKIEKIEKNQSTKKIIEKDEKIEKVAGLPKILLLSTGGTIASKIDYRTGAVTPVLTAEELNSSVPELAKIANIDAQVLFSEYSENIMPEHWLQIAEKINEYSKSDYTGIIIAHGTDTMHYTSSFLSFALAGFPIPIVLVGSQRSSDRASSDAALNLISATKFITESKTKGVYIVMHQDENDGTIACHLGTRVRKNHTSKRGAFQTIGDVPAFIIVEDQIQKNITEDFFKVNEFQPKIYLDTKVALVKYHPGYDPRLLDKIIEMGFRGIIFEGTGLGHVGKTMYESVKKANEKGIFLGMTSQCIDGRVRMTVYESGRDLLDLGIVPLENMIPEVALVKAMWAMGNSQNRDEVKKIMLENIASELSN
ncbi:Glu-tRNA(Gln) amidotransferase subunit GatD [Marine Group I thaumarchaeote]|jgi:glutamyl-tRNA(Gln) amidotransferase subunit D|uniref:Glutamyl-tRNA(Gln) amidotransferase subunit D n=1 Tax=Marine Group I thaumarchaeote TaxID=2511932 RepID=A0A7K4P6J6_9ARCH|nr:MAG: Glu-tRNA(Gln) amidotransferase GatDE subunit D [Nitrosopumilus sp. YT1]NMI82469.1 Glu-tRNA(Gln) amidotransferase subunit GatD [Candidatus Nitrosopumilus sp. MTA1]NWJ20500.1 Glu-tRNA(Gln) amidotransferase subunit GatD [Marine Group I thaumarchaeote]NWJ56593.1 Glu-tRNA(Gln) amidotransferase subunit GatD [Marine Group I thaumarchaeote]NWJ83139.1 Glu-tRNA(Gln) amidotransferase subunit GatD [Marine Group I thaumarchaeote]